MEIHNKETLFDAIFETELCGIIFFTLDNIVAYANKKSLELWGLDESVIGTKLGNLYYKDDADYIYAGLDSLIKGEIPVLKVTHRYYRSDGTIHWATSNTTIYYEPDGTPMIESVFVDVTDLKEAEAAALEHSAMIDLVMENSKLMTFNLYPQENYLICSDKLVAASGKVIDAEKKSEIDALLKKSLSDDSPAGYIEKELAQKGIQMEQSDKTQTAGTTVKPAVMPVTADTPIMRFFSRTICFLTRICSYLISFSVREILPQ